MPDWKKRTLCCWNSVTGLGGGVLAVETKGLSINAQPLVFYIFVNKDSSNLQDIAASGIGRFGISFFVGQRPFL